MTVTAGNTSSPGVLPVARVAHHLRHRMRIAFEDGRPQGARGEQVATTLEQLLPEVKVRCNPVTGSLVMEGSPAAIEKIPVTAEKAGLFQVQARPAAPPLAVRVTEPLGRVSDYLERVTRGSVDLPGMVFLSALFLGLYELARGNFRPPPWYTAFWYAFGMYSKSFMDRRAEAKKAH